MKVLVTDAGGFLGQQLAVAMPHSVLLVPTQFYKRLRFFALGASSSYINGIKFHHVLQSSTQKSESRLKFVVETRVTAWHILFL